MIRVMIVEANQYLRMGLRQSLEKEDDLTVVGEFGEAAVNGAEILGHWGGVIVYH